MPNRGVYIITAFDSPERATRVKIGCCWAKSIWERVRELGLTNVQVLLTFPGRSREEVLQTEAWLHERFAHLRCSEGHEWFRLTDELKCFIDAHRNGAPIWGAPALEPKQPQEREPRRIPCYVNGVLDGYLEEVWPEPKPERKGPGLLRRLLGPFVSQ